MMSSKRLVVIVVAAAFSVMAVPVRAATIQIVMENLVISPAEAGQGRRYHRMDQQGHRRAYGNR